MSLQPIYSVCLALKPLPAYHKLSHNNKASNNNGDHIACHVPHEVSSIAKSLYLSIFSDSLLETLLSAGTDISIIVMVFIRSTS